MRKFRLSTTLPPSFSTITALSAENRLYIITFQDSLNASDKSI